MVFISNMRLEVEGTSYVMALWMEVCENWIAARNFAEEERDNFHKKVVKIMKKFIMSKNQM